MAETRSIKNLEVFAPRVRVRFHTEDGAFEVATKDQPGGQEQSLVACQTYKDIGQPTGSFMVHLADFGRYDKLLKPMDMVTISMSNHTPFAPSTGNLSFSRDQLTHATMIGFVDSVRRKRLIDPSTGKPNVFCEIKGRDFGKLMVKHQIRYIPWLVEQLEGEAMLAPVVAMFKSLLSGFLTGGDIDFLVANNFQKMLKNVEMSVHFNKRLVSVMNSFSYRANKELGVIPYNLPVMAQEGSLWQVLGNFANLPFNEMWVDTINNPKRVIDDSESSVFSSPLTTDELSKVRGRASQYIKAQTSSSDREQSVKNFGASGEKISTAERYVGEPDNSNAYTMLFLRRTPFDADDWKALPRIFISNADIQEQDLGISDHEVYNMFWVYPLLPIPNELTLKALGSTPVLFSRRRQFLETSDKDNAYPKAIVLTGDTSSLPTSDADAARKHAAISRRNAVEKFGLLPMEQRTRVWAWSKQGKMNNVTRTANLLTQTLANWYKHNGILKNGSMTIKGLPDMHVGNVLVNVDENEEYYVEGVANSYVQYQPMTTTVMVTRGQRIGEINWGNAYRDFCKGKPLGVGAQQEEVAQ